MSPDYDVFIVGGGPVGAALALALRGSGLAIGQLEARAARAPADSRPIALSHGSRLVLERLGAWERIAGATPIRRIHVSQRGGWGRVSVDARDAGVPALGYVLDYRVLAEALAGALEAGGGMDRLYGSAGAFEPGSDTAVVRFDSDRGEGRVGARLLAVADGGALPVAQMRVRDYGQAAVTARVTCDVAHQNTAFERFTPDGPLALLPTGEALALVWTTRPEEARRLCEMPEAEFLARLQDGFGSRLGRFRAASDRASFPLALRVAVRSAEPRMVALGNAAQTLHPVAGQGLNLGLRDAWELAACVRDCDRAAIGGADCLRRYAARRRLDRGGAIVFTDSLVRLFSNDTAILKLARGLGLTALGAFPPVRDLVARRMIFGARG